jgi:endonuclease III
MMRRGGMLTAAPDTQALIPCKYDTEKVIEAKWKKWTERESFKRLVHALVYYGVIYC